ncbi:hypothetical protein BYT27DRAFT_6777102 [Phlegmacium glaucopus]|nr:hypothetical protein BYT27DRAFT_6777102 [Phlegmacium glaucopus]
MKSEKKSSPATGGPRGRGSYNPACDVCARRKIKCDGIKPVCQPCQSQVRQKECTWTRNPVRKPRTEAYVEAMHKRVETLRQCVKDFRRYSDHLESLLAECQQHHQQHRNIDFRASRPLDPEGLLDVPTPDFDFTDQGSDDGGDPAVMSICIPTRSLQVQDGGGTLHHGTTAPFRFVEFTPPSRFPALAADPDGTYVLLVEGADPSHYNPAFDWSRHLPSAVPLDRRSHDKALDLLFKFFTSWCLRIVPALFLRDMYRALCLPPSQTPPKTPHYSPMLHNALVALALAFLDEPRFRDLKSRQYFANTAKSFVEAECRNPNLSVVHALSILSSFHNSQGDQTLGYLYFGMSARISQAQWVKRGLMDEADRLDRHWANWTTFTQDVCWSLYVGRDFCVPAPVSADTQAIMSYIDPEFDEMPWFYPPSRLAPQPNHLTKTFEATCRLLVIARRIMDVVNGLNPTRNRTDALITDIDVQLNMWNDSLATELEITPFTATPHKLMLHLAYWWLSILLHRPFFHRKSRPIHSADPQVDHVKLCRRAAGKIMELLLTWRNLYTLRYCPITLIQTVFDAGTVHFLTAMQACSGIRLAQKELRKSWDQATLVLQYLQEIGVSWESATNISGILRNLMDEHVRPLMERKPISIAAAGLQIPGDMGDDEEENGPALSHSNSKSSHIGKGSSITKTKSRQATNPRIISSSGSSFVRSGSSFEFSYYHCFLGSTGSFNLCCPFCSNCDSVSKQRSQLQPRSQPRFQPRH